MFDLEDIVVYRHHVCTVAGIREAYFDDKDYFELHTLFEKSLKLYVAIESAEPPVMRAVMTREEALALIDEIPAIGTIDDAILRAEGATLSLAERQVKEEYERHLKRCDPHDLVAIIKSSSLRTQERAGTGKRSTAVDKKYFELAERLLCDELAISLGMEREDVPAFVAERLQV